MALRHLQDETERLLQYAERCLSDLAQMGARDGELQEEVPDLGCGLWEMWAALGKSQSRRSRSRTYSGHERKSLG